MRAITAWCLADSGKCGLQLAGQRLHGAAQAGLRAVGRQQFKQEAQRHADRFGFADAAVAPHGVVVQGQKYGARGDAGIDGAVFVRVALASCSKSPSCASSARQASLSPWAFNSRAPAST